MGWHAWAGSTGPTPPLDSSSVRAIGAGEVTGPNPVDRAKPGSQRHLAVDGNGTPLALILTKAHRNDGQECLPLLDALPPLVGPAGGRPRRAARGGAGRRRLWQPGQPGRRAETRHRTAAGTTAPRTRQWLGRAALGGGGHHAAPEPIP